MSHNPRKLFLCFGVDVVVVHVVVVVIPVVDLRNIPLKFGQVINRWYVVNAVVVSVVVVDNPRNLLLKLG